MIECRGLLHHACLCEYRMCEDKANDESTNNQDGTIILKVCIHCEGCAKEVKKSLCGFEGVECVEIDAKNDKVIVKGKKADPTKVAERVRKKTGKQVELISPKPKKEMKKEVKKPELKVIEVVLKINMHCERCAKEVKKCICKMEGGHRPQTRNDIAQDTWARVQTVETDTQKNQVTVKGTMDLKKLVEFINKRCGREAEIVKKDDGGCGGENGSHCGCGCGGVNGGRCCNYPPQIVCVPNYSRCCGCGCRYPAGIVCAPQLFSDENPNACSVM